MTSVTLEKEFRVAPEGHTTVVLPKGAVVEGRVAELAIETGHAKRPQRAPKHTKPAFGPSEAK